MKHCLALAFALCSALPAQVVKLLPIDSSIVGVTMIGPNDPGFQALAVSLLPPDELAAAAPYLPESVIVTNKSGQAIEALGMIFAEDGPNGLAMQNGSFMVEDSFWKPLMAAGEQRIMISGGPIENRIRSGKQPKRPAAGNISVSIDLVIYANWLAAGPDHHQHLKRLLSSMHAEEDVCTQLGSGTPGTETLALLEKEAAAVVSPPPRESADWYAWDFQHMAERLVSSLHAGDSDFAHRTCTPVLAASNIVASLHR